MQLRLLPTYHLPFDSFLVKVIFVRFSRLKSDGLISSFHSTAFSFFSSFHFSKNLILWVAKSKNKATKFVACIIWIITSFFFFSPINFSIQQIFCFSINFSTIFLECILSDLLCLEFETKKFISNISKKIFTPNFRAVKWRIHPTLFLELLLWLGTFSESFGNQLTFSFYLVFQLLSLSINLYLKKKKYSRYWNQNSLISVLRLELSDEIQGFENKVLRIIYGYVRRHTKWGSRVKALRVQEEVTSTRRRKIVVEDLGSQLRRCHKV